MFAQSYSLLFLVRALQILNNHHGHEYETENCTARGKNEHVGACPFLIKSFVFAVNFSLLRAMWNYFSQSHLLF